MSQLELPRERIVKAKSWFLTRLRYSAQNPRTGAHTTLVKFVHVYRILMEAFPCHLNIELKSVMYSDWWRRSTTIFHAIMVGPQKNPGSSTIEGVAQPRPINRFCGKSPLDADRSTQVWKRDIQLAACRLQHVYARQKSQGEMPKGKR